MVLYLDKISIQNTIEYFSNLSIASPEQLGLFFFFKSIGVRNDEYFTFSKASQMSDEEKEFFNNRLYLLGGLFTENEQGLKRTCLFPFSINNSIKQKDFYNGGSKFNQLLSRINDTVDNTLVDKFLDKNEQGQIKLKRNYLRIIMDTYMQGNKISLIYLSLWFCRFIGFDIENQTEISNFKRMCVKFTKKNLNLTEEEINHLFYDDTNNVEVVLSKEPINGNEFRSLFQFNDEPEVLQQTQLDLNKPFTVPADEVKKYMELNDKNPTSQEIKEILKLKKQIILYGVPGVGKSRFISEIAKEYDPDKVVKIQFHPNTTYEDFIGGTTIESGSLRTKPGIFLETCIKAKNSNKDFLFVIDEINRGNISKIFGETILTLDREYEVNLIKPFIVDGKEITKFSIPRNLHIIGTMNSSDRSIAILDYAIRRRFAFVKLYPNYEVVKELTDDQNIDVSIAQLFKSINNKIIETLNDEDLLLGQSYFLPDFIKNEVGKYVWTNESLRRVFNYFIIPILEEYTYGNRSDLISILGERLLSRIDEDDEFIKAIIEFFPEAKKYKG